MGTSQWYGLTFLAIGGLLLTIGDVVFKFWAKEALARYYVSGLALYLMGMLCLVESFKTHNMAVASAIFVVVNIVTLAIVSWLYFAEPLTSQQMVGISLAIVAVFFLA